MPTEQQIQQDKKLQQHKSEIFDDLISEQVIHRLGMLDNLQAVQVRRLWEAHYRVNVLVGEDAIFAKVGPSYFVEVDSDGHIIGSNPKFSNVR